MANHYLTDETMPKKDEIPVSVSLRLLNSTVADPTQTPVVQGLLRFSSSVLLVSAEKHEYALEGRMVIDVELPSEIGADRRLTHWEGNDGNITLPIPVTMNSVGNFTVSATAVNYGNDFSTTSRLMIWVTDTQDQLLERLAVAKKPIAASKAIDSSRLVSPKVSAPSMYAHVYGIACTYPYSSGISYMLRGVQMELWDTLLGVPTTKLKTVFTVEPSSDPDYGLTPNNYVSSNTWYHVDQSGYFDFGNVYVGFLGNYLVVRMVFTFHDSGDGTSASGTEKLSVLDVSNSNQAFSRDYTIYCSSGQECGLVGIQAPSLGSSGGADDAAHVFYDITKTYSYLKRLGVFMPSDLPVYVNLADLNDTVESFGYKIYLAHASFDYLAFEGTDVIIHEYSHSVHWQMRGGSFPPLPDGDSNHGGCTYNSYSSDALTEGWAEYLPTVVLKDPVWRWDSWSSTYDISSNSGIFAECERSEWTFAAILWDIQHDIGGGSHEWFKRIAQGLDSNDFVRDCYNEFILNWGYHDQVWQVFANHNVVYEYKLTMQVSPLNGGTTSPTVGTNWYDSGRMLYIYAYPASGYTFTSWTGSGLGSYSGTTTPAIITMNGPITETANFLSPVTVTTTMTITQTSTSYSYRTTTTTSTSYTSTTTSTSTIPTVTTVVLVPLTITSTEQGTRFLTPVVTTTTTSYTGTTTLTSTIPTTVALVQSTVTSIVQSIQYLTSILSTTTTSYTGTQTSTSTVVVPTTVVLVPFSATSTVQSTQSLSSTATTTMTSYTSTVTLTSTVPTVTTVVLLPTTTTSTVQNTQFLTSTLTTTTTSYTATVISTSTSVVYTTVTASQGEAGGAGSIPLTYFSFFSLLAITVGHKVVTNRPKKTPKARSTPMPPTS